MSRTVLEHRVKRLGHSVVIANSGLEAIIALDREPVDLVLLDIVMAEMDGREVLARCQSGRTLRRSPDCDGVGIGNPGRRNRMPRSGCL